MDMGPAPALFLANTLNVYTVPFVRLFNVRLVLVSVVEYPPGVAVRV